MQRTLLPLVVVAVLSTTATLGLSRLAFPAAGAAGAQEPTVVRAQRFELVDGNGAVRATLAVNPAGLSSFALLDEAGQQRFIIAGNPMGGYAMSIRAADGAVRFAVGHGASEGEAFAGLNIRDATGRIRANITATDDGSDAAIRVFDDAGSVIWQAP